MAKQERAHSAWNNAELSVEIGKYGDHWANRLSVGHLNFFQICSKHKNAVMRSLFSKPKPICYKLYIGVFNEVNMSFFLNFSQGHRGYQKDTTQVLHWSMMSLPSVMFEVSHF